jgi:hypothetical protein
MNRNKLKTDEGKLIEIQRVWSQTTDCPFLRIGYDARKRGVPRNRGGRLTSTQAHVVMEILASLVWGGEDAVWGGLGLLTAREKKKRGQRYRTFMPCNDKERAKDVPHTPQKASLSHEGLAKRICHA